MEAIIGSHAVVGKSTSFAVKIVDNFGNTHERVVPLITKSKYQAELAAIKYVFQAIQYKDVDLTLKTAVHQIPQIFQKNKNGKFVKRKRPNELVDELRELSSRFKSFECVLDKDGEEVTAIREKARLVNSI